MNTKPPNLESTRAAYVSTRVLDTPFWALFNLIPFIMYKDLNASPLELAILVTLKPLVSIFSSYFSNHVDQTNLKKGIIFARILAFLPFFALPFIHSTSYLIACYGLFMFLQVGMLPVWIELLKQNIPSPMRDKVVSYTQAFGYLGGGLLPFAIGWILDEWKGSWVLMFPIAGVFALGSIFWQRKICPNEGAERKSSDQHPLLKPWSSAFHLLKDRKDFAYFQMGFMILGMGLMIIQPTLPVFFVDQLHLSYTEVAVAITLCKGIGYAFSSPLWVRWIQRYNLFHVVSGVAALATLFAVLLLGAKAEIFLLYGAYIIYGLMQAGSELCWNLSGPIFAKNQDSAPFSNVNVIAVGIRGIFVPTLGAFFLSEFGSSFVICLSALICALAMTIGAPARSTTTQAALSKH